jgi:hypothetical protein
MTEETRSPLPERGGKTARIIGGTVALACAALFAAPAATAAKVPKAIQQGYGNPVSRTAGTIDTQRQVGGVAAMTAQRSRLPFTGFDLALLTAGGGGLLALGAGLRRAGRAES